MRIPWSVPTVSDATKLGPASRCPSPLTGERLYSLPFKNVLTDNLSTLGNWTKVGHKGLIKTVPTQAKFAAVPTIDDACVRKDFGASFFGDFTSDFDLILQSASSTTNSVGVWGVSAGASRTIAALLTAVDGMLIGWYAVGANHVLCLYDMTSGAATNYDTGIALTTFPATLYCRVNRTGSTWTLTVYTTAARTTEVGHVSVAGPATAYRYMYSGLSRYAGLTFDYSFTTQNLTVTSGGTAVDFNDGLWLILSASETPRISLAAGLLSVVGSGSWGHNGVYLTPALDRAEGYIEIKHLAPAADTYAGTMGLGHNAAAPWLPNTQTLFSAFISYTAGWCSVQGPSNRITSSYTAPMTPGTYYTLRIYLLKSSQGAWIQHVWTVQGGAQFPVETVVASLEVPEAPAAAKIFAFVQKQQANQTNTYKEFRAYFGYATDGPTLTYVGDAGAGKTFSGLVFANLAAVGSWVTTNTKFQYSYDDGTPAYNANWLTLAELNAVAALTTSKRYIRLQVQVNSDGATQQYAGELNADDGTAMPAASEPESSASEASVSETSASEVSYSASSASELSVSSESPLSGSSASDSSGSHSSYSDSSATSASTSESSNSVSASSNSSSESGLGVAANDWEMQIRGEGDTVTVQRRTLTKTATGAQQCTWTSDGASLYAMVQDASSNDRTAYAERQIRVTHSVFVAVDPVVVEGTRLLWGTKTLIVHGVRDMLNRGELWQLDCEEVK